jgi:hypothetical protein
MYDEKKEDVFFEIKIWVGNKEMYYQKFHQDYVIRYDPDFIARIVASVNNFKYEPNDKNV